AEDGIRDFHVTGVQTCALPILVPAARHRGVHARQLLVLTLLGLLRGGLRGPSRRRSPQEGRCGVTSVPAARPAPRALPRPRRTTSPVRSVLKHACLVALSLLMVYPLIWLVVSSLKHNEAIFTDLSIFTSDLTLENYVYGWTSQQLPFGRFLLNSTILSLGAIVGNLVSCSLAAYA